MIGSSHSAYILWLVLIHWLGLLQWLVGTWGIKTVAYL